MSELPPPEGRAPPPSPFAVPAIRLVETELDLPLLQDAFALVTSPHRAAAVLHELIGKKDREHFAALFVNARTQVTHAHIVSMGTLGSAPIHPREVFKAAVLANAAKVIVGHNHPSGDTEPSSCDRAVTVRLREAGDLLGIKVLDALIVGPKNEFFAESTESVEVLRRPAADVSVA